MNSGYGIGPNAMQIWGPVSVLLVTSSVTLFNLTSLCLSFLTCKLGQNESTSQIDYNYCSLKAYQVSGAGPTISSHCLI